jgi:Ca2+-binding EF-hand superfamily protein
MDKNRDGTITPEEIAHSVITMKINLNDIQMAELLNRMDYDGDGTFAHCCFLCLFLMLS